MALGQTEMALGGKAPDFRLPATDGRTYALKDAAGENGAVIVFICNHCPYVKAVIGRLTADARALMAEGVGFAAISSNDAASYPEDSFPKMREFALAHDFPFPYLHDETQDGRARLWRRLHARLLRLRPRSQAQIPRPARRGPHDAAAPERAAASSSKRCAPSPQACRRRRTRSRRSAARSSGRRGVGEAQPTSWPGLSRPSTSLRRLPPDVASPGCAAAGSTS